MQRVEKRLSFGFKGEWGKCYKLWTFDETPENNSITFQKSNYVDIGEDIQFKYVESATTEVTQPIQNLPTTSEMRTIITSDAYLDYDTNNYQCIVGINDIIKAFGYYWLVVKVDEKSIFTPNKQTIYYLSCKKVFKETIQEQK